MVASAPFEEYVESVLAEPDPRCELVRITRPQTGLGNHVLFVSTAGGDYVLKVFADDTGLWKPQKERAMCCHMRSIGILAHRILRIETSKRVVSFIYSLAERRPEMPLSDVSTALGDADFASIYATLGDYLGRLHSMTFGQFGDIDGSANGLALAALRQVASAAPSADDGPFATWSEMHWQTVRARLATMKGTAFEDLTPPLSAFSTLTIT